MSSGTTFDQISNIPLRCTSAAIKGILFQKMAFFDGRPLRLSNYCQGAQHDVERGGGRGG